MKKLFIMVSLLSVILFAGDIEIKNAYVRAVPPNLPNSAFFMKIVNNTNKDIFLQSADSSVAKNAELHEHTMSKGMMKMQQVKEIKIPAKSSVELKPGGYHIMLLGLNKKLHAGNFVDSVSLHFSNNKTIKITRVPIKTIMMGMKSKK